MVEGYDDHSVSLKVEKNELERFKKDHGEDLAR
jgi:hypothetical protein